MYRTLMAAVILVPTSALAQDADVALDSRFDLRQDEPAEEAPTSSGPVSTVASDRGYDMEVNFRGRYVFVPNSIIDIWYFNNEEHADVGFGFVPDRPTIQGFGLGLEFVVKGETANGIFYLDWLNSSLDPGYWDDREGLGDEVYDDGEYWRPTDTLGLLAFGANYAYEAHFVRTAETNGAFGLSFLVGGGLGVGIMIGDLDVWTYDDDSSTPSYDRFDSEPPDGTGSIPKVYPMVDVNAGLRFNFGDRVVLRIEGGLHTLIYGGATLGIMF